MTRGMLLNNCRCYICAGTSDQSIETTANSGVAVAYNMFIKIRKAWVDPDFDYGRCFNYKETKWTSLLNNYCLLYTSETLWSKDYLLYYIT